MHAEAFFLCTTAPCLHDWAAKVVQERLGAEFSLESSTAPRRATRGGGEERRGDRAEVSAGLFCRCGAAGEIRRNVAERETHFLPTGAQQNRVGGPGALPQLISRRLRCLRIRMVSSCCRVTIESTVAQRIPSTHRGPSELPPCGAAYQSV